MKIDPAKTYRTRDGREVRIYAVDGGSGFPVHGAYLQANGGLCWLHDAWTADGLNNAGRSYAKESHIDLIEVRPKHKGWVNVFRDGKDGARIGTAVPYRLRSEADAQPISLVNRIACLQIEFEEGEGL